MLLSIIVPIRYKKNRDIISLLEEKILFADVSECCEYIVVDDGSQREEAERIRLCCYDLGIKYFYIDSGEKEFSLSRARNWGATQSKAKYVLFEDIDLVVTRGFYRKLCEEIKVQKLSENSRRFMIFPAVYLTQNASISFQEEKDERSFSFVVQKIFQRDDEYCSHFSPVTSAKLLDREYFLAIGGYDEQFSGWGFEDSELAFRLLSSNKEFPAPRQFLLTNTQQYQYQCRYKGWRSQLRIYGNISLIKGLLYVHKFHEEDVCAKRRKFPNLRLCKNKMRKFWKVGHSLDPLPGVDSNKVRQYRIIGDSHYKFPFQSILFDCYRRDVMTFQEKKNQLWQRIKFLYIFLTC